MAMDTKERSEVTANNRAARGEEELRLWCMKGTRNQLKELMEWTEDSQQASVMTLAIWYIHSLGPKAAREALIPRHDLKLKNSWRERFDNESRRELVRDPGEEIIAPQSL
jgi:hypothetical protein